MNAKEQLRDDILVAMQNTLNQVQMDILKEVLLKEFFNVAISEMETLPATMDDTNQGILEKYMLKKAPKLSQKTVKYYLQTVKHFIVFSNKSLLDATDMDVEYYLEWYRKIGFRGKGNNTSTVNNERRNLSAFFTWMRKTHITTDNPVDGVEKYGEIEKPIDYMEDWEMEALRDACKVKKVNKVTKIEAYKECLRDRALVEVFRSTAVRVTEGSTINVDDINWTSGEIVVYGEKTRTYRIVCIDDVAKFHLRKYIDSRTDDNPALFVGIRGDHNRLTKSGIEAAFRTIAKRSILERRVYPHLFRKTTATNMSKRGCPRTLIAFYLGHKDGNTKTLNRHYASTDPEQIKQAFWQYGAAA